MIVPVALIAQEAVQFEPALDQPLAAGDGRLELGDGDRGLVVEVGGGFEDLQGLGDFEVGSGVAVCEATFSVLSRGGTGFFLLLMGSRIKGGIGLEGISSAIGAGPASSPPATTTSGPLASAKPNRFTTID